MKIVRINPYQQNGNGKLRAYFDIQMDDGIIIKGFRIINGQNGLFISPPTEKGKDGKYYESVIIPQEIRNSIQKIAIAEYNK